MIEYLIPFLILALVAEILGTLGGFGSSLFFIPIASYFLDMHSVLGITALFHVSSNITKIAFFRKGFDKRLIISIGIPAVLFVVLGAYISKFIETKTLELGLAIFLLIASFTLYSFKTIIINPSVKNSILGGVLSGFLTGLIGTGGAVRGITLAAFNLKMQVFIATSAIIDLGIDSSRGIVYFFNGYMHNHDLYLIPMLLVVSILGTYIGKRLLTHLSEEKFKSIALLLVFITGCASLIKVLL